MPMPLITGTAGDDIKNGTALSDTMLGLGGGDVLSGEAGLDRLYGGDGADALKGDGGNDRLDGGEGNDLLLGGEGFDTANYSAAKGSVTVSLDLGIAFGAMGGDALDSIERVIGSRFDDILYGGGRGDLLAEGWTRQ
jgi:Ca2+-binding RTX toxin-like protein